MQDTETKPDTQTVYTLNVLYSTTSRNIEEYHMNAAKQSKVFAYMPHKILLYKGNASSYSTSQVVYSIEGSTATDASSFYFLDGPATTSVNQWGEQKTYSITLYSTSEYTLAN